MRYLELKTLVYLLFTKYKYIRDKTNDNSLLFTSSHSNSFIKIIHISIGFMLNYFGYQNTNIFIVIFIIFKDL